MDSWATKVGRAESWTDDVSDASFEAEESGDVECVGSACRVSEKHMFQSKVNLIKSC